MYVAKFYATTVIMHMNCNIGLYILRLGGIEKIITIHCENYSAITIILLYHGIFVAHSERPWAMAGF